MQISIRQKAFGHIQRKIVFNGALFVLFFWASCCFSEIIEYPSIDTLAINSNIIIKGNIEKLVLHKNVASFDFFVEETIKDNKEVVNDNHISFNMRVELLPKDIKDYMLSKNGILLFLKHSDNNRISPIELRLPLSIFNLSSTENNDPLITRQFDLLREKEVILSYCRMVVNKFEDIDRSQIKMQKKNTI